MEENENQAVGSKNIPKKQPKKSGSLKNVIALVLVALICTGFGFFLGSIALENKEEAVNTTANTTESNTGSNSGNNSESNSETSKDNTNACEHVIVKIDETPATCEKDGLTEGQKCSLCGEILVQQNKIPAAHTPSAEPTCTAAQKCTACNAELKAALGHTPGEWETLKEPTTTENGQKVKKCTVCGEKADEQLIPATGSVGLSFIANVDGTGYYVSGLGNCKDINIVIPSTYDGKSVTSIGDGAFYMCDGLTSVTIPDSVTSIGERAFAHCSNLLKVTIGNSVTSIGQEVFAGCYSLVQVTIGNGVTSIGQEAFDGCYSLTSITIPDRVTSFGSYAFRGCTSLTSVVIPDSVTSIGDSAFYNCTGLTSVMIGKGVTIIGNAAFSGCSALTSVTIPNGILKIDASVFQGCTALTSVTIPNSVVRIMSSAFHGCRSLTNITFNGTIAEWNFIFREAGWDTDIPAAKVICSDGEVSI